MTNDDRLAAARAPAYRYQDRYLGRPNYPASRLECGLHDADLERPGSGRRCQLSVAKEAKK